MKGGGYKAAFAVLSCLVISVLGQGDRPCPGQTTCTVATQCPWYLELSKLSRTDQAQYERRIPEINQSVCNKKERKVCCPSADDSEEAHSTAFNGELPCSGQTTCTVAKQCPWFLQITKLKDTNKVEYNKRLPEIKKSVCNNKAKKVCCPPQKFLQEDSFSPSWIPSLTRQECGDPHGTAFIVGGEDTLNGEFPWTVLLGTNASRPLQWYCGGSLINRWYVVTAAHCTRPTVVRVGEWRVVDDTKPDINKKLVFSTKQLRSCRRRNRPCRNFHLFDSSRDCVDDFGEFVYSARQEYANCGPPHQDINVASYIKHPQYRELRSGASINDISLVKLEKPVRFASEGQSLSNVSPICLPFPGTIEGSPEAIGELGSGFPNPKGVVVGWGQTYDGTDRAVTKSINSVKQKKLTVPFISNARCQDIYAAQGLSRGTIRSQYHLCAGAEVGRDSCDGDSGGPLIYRQNGNSPYWLVGIVSFGTTRCAQGIPAVFTRTTSYIDWIRQNLA